MAAAAVLGVNAAIADTKRFDFGTTGTEPGYVAVDNVTTWSAGLGYGWVSTNGLNVRDRGGPGALRRDFIFDNTTSGLTFRVSGLTPNGKPPPIPPALALLSCLAAVSLFRLVQQIKVLPQY